MNFPENWNCVRRGNSKISFNETDSANSGDSVNRTLKTRACQSQIPGPRTRSRKKLSENAKRAGWIGCNILLNDLPKSGKIFYIRDRQVKDKESVLDNWAKTLFLRETKNSELKGWILDIMNCIDKLEKQEFTLQDVYMFEDILSVMHPENKHVKDKIRQQLQFLRDKEYLRFLGNGKYQLI